MDDKVVLTVTLNKALNQLECEIVNEDSDLDLFHLLCAVSDEYIRRLGPREASRMMASAFTAACNARKPVEDKQSSTSKLLS